MQVVRIPAGSTKKIMLMLQKKDTNGNDVHGTHHALFLFTSNDPIVGAFSIDVTGTVQ